MSFEEGDHALVQGGGDEAFGSDCQADVKLTVASLLSDEQWMTDKTWGTEFTDNELLKIMFENIVEEKAVLTMSSSKGTKVGKFIVTTSQLNKVHNITDELQKSLVLIEGTPGREGELLAMSLPGGSIHKNVQWNLLLYTSLTMTKNSGQPIILKIAGTNLYLSCHGPPEKPVLTLKKIQDSESLKTITEGDDMMQFLFLKKNSDFSTVTFESAALRGFFISTASDDNKLVKMCQISTPGRHTAFKVYQK